MGSSRPNTIYWWSKQRTQIIKLYVIIIYAYSQKRLLDAMRACEKNLTPAEVKRNRHGPMQQYDYHPESQGSAPGIFSLRPLYSVFCTEQQIWSKEIAVPSDKSVCVELPNAAREVFFPGFPTMKHLKYDVCGI